MSTGLSSPSSSSNSSSSSKGGGRKRSREGVTLGDSKGKISLVYGDTFGGRNLRLMEAPADVVSYISAGNDINLIGPIEKGGDVVLCTGDKTFSIKKVETSNHLFLVPPSTSTEGEFVLESSIKDYYEVKPAEGRTDKLAEILKNSLYEGKGASEEEMVDEKDLLTRTQLEEQIQASAQELHDALEALGVVEVRGKMRLLDENLRRSSTRELLDTIMIQRWDMSKIEENECRKSMPDTDEIYLRHSLYTLGTAVVDGMVDSDGKVWSLDKDKVAKATAHILFQNQKGGNSAIWPADDFVGEWSSRTPDSSSGGAALSGPDRALLAGIAVQVGDGYRYAPAEQVNLLPKAEERFKHMASIKQKYSQEEIAPYCTGLFGSAGQPRSIAELLLKHSKFLDNLYILRT